MQRKSTRYGSGFRPFSVSWAFYAPSLTGQALNGYLTRQRGYVAFDTINAGEGFWVERQEAFTASLNSGYAVTAGQLAPALVSGSRTSSLVGEAPQTPAQFNGALGYDITTLWAWDAQASRWYFYAPCWNAAAR